MDVTSLLFGHSKALYSTWICYKPDHLLVDCGEGAATTLGNGGFAVERVLLTHGHIDHISGLPSLLWSRAAGMGDNEKPLQIYYPQGDVFVADMQLYLQRTQARLPFELHWIPLGAGDSFALGEALTGGIRGKTRGGRRVVTFATRHIRGQLTLGYKIVETRRRLKPEFAGLPQEEIRARALALKAAGGDAAELSEDYEATLAAFGGDGLALEPSDVRGSELLVHEATILDPAERKHQWHATLDEAVQTAVAARVKTLLLYHVSGRYRADDVRRIAHASIGRHGVELPVWCLFRDRLWNVREPAREARRERPARENT